MNASKKEKASLVIDIPCSLVNLGDTCFSNSIIQCLHSSNLCFKAYENSNLPSKSSKKFQCNRPPSIKSITTCSTTTFELNPVCKETENLLAWYQTCGDLSDSEFKN